MHIRPFGRGLAKFERMADRPMEADRNEQQALRSRRWFGQRGAHVLVPSDSGLSNRQRGDSAQLEVHHRMHEHVRKFGLGRLLANQTTVLPERCGLRGGVRHGMDRRETPLPHLRRSW